MTRLTADDFNRLYREHARRAQGFFLRMTGDPALAEDLTQELFTRLWEHRKSYESGRSFTTWMYSVAYNLCKNEYRHREVVEAYLNENSLRTEEAVEETEPLAREEQKRLLAEAVQRLPDGVRDVFLLRYEEDLPIADVARILGIPEGTVKSRAYTALTTLRECMKTYK